MNQTGALWSEMALFLLYSAGYAWSVHRFCTSHFICIRRREKSFLLLLTVSLPILNAVSLLSLLPHPIAALMPLLGQLLLILWIILLYQGQIAQKILAASILLAVTLLSQHFTESLLICPTLILLHLTQDVPAPQIGTPAWCMIECIIFACTIWSIAWLTRRTGGFFANRPHSWYNMLSAPLLGMTLLWDCIDICASHGILLRGGDYLNLYYNQLFSHIGLLVLAALCMGGAGFYVFGMDRIDLEQKQKEQYRSQVALYQMLEEQYGHLERLRHDMKNHIIGLQRLIDNRAWDQMTDYLHKMADAGGIGRTDDMTGRGIVDALLYHKREQAAHAHIRWECDVQLPPLCTIDDFDLCVIFGNLLDNALMACTKMPEHTDRFIQIRAHMVKKCLLLEISNSTDSPITSTEKTPSADHANPHTTSEQADAIGQPPRQRGIGLRNVRDAANKYNGILRIDARDHAFHASVLLPCAGRIPP